MMEKNRMKRKEKREREREREREVLGVDTCGSKREYEAN